MSKKIIPQICVTICDHCGAESKNSCIVGDPFYDGEIHLQCEERITDEMGDDSGTTFDYDLCYKCSKEFKKWMSKKES